MCTDNDFHDDIFFYGTWKKIVTRGQNSLAFAESQNRVFEDSYDGVHVLYLLKL